MNRLLVASRTRPDIDLPKYLGMPQFSVVPLSLFTPLSLYYLKDKAANATELRNFQAAKENQSIEEFSSNAREVAVIDGMAIVNNINITNGQISNCDDLAKCFTDRTTNKTEDCGELSVGFDKHNPHSLKNNTRSNRTKDFLLCAIKFLIQLEHHIFQRSSSFREL